MGDDDKLDRTAARLMDDWRETNESWTQLIERIDAALRRAKAEGMREASDMVEDDCYALSESDVSDPTHAAKVLHNVNQQALSNKIDARAAQIENEATK